MTAERVSLEWLENPEIFQVNREKAHSDHLFYEKEEEISLEEKMPLAQCPVSYTHLVLRLTVFLQFSQWLFVILQ